MATSEEIYRDMMLVMSRIRSAGAATHEVGQSLTRAPLGGAKVYSNPNCLEPTNNPMRKHPEKHWMQGRCYHRRVQKKWNKRWGFRMRPTAYLISQPAFGDAPMVVAHPAIVAKLQQEDGEDG